MTFRLLEGHLNGHLITYVVMYEFNLALLFSDRMHGLSSSRPKQS